ncbi:MAG: stage II sporulation protein M [Thermosynechococcaceae cyanobacterium]
MDIQRWLARQEPRWQRLEGLLQQAESKSLKKLSAQEVQELSGLYRLVASDLARAKARQVGPAITEKLQGLTRRGYAQIYQGGRRQEWRKIIDFILWGFPKIVQETWIQIAIATSIFLIGGLMGWWYTWRDPAFMQVIIPPHIIDLVQERGELWMGSIVGSEPLASSSITQNNISVTFATFAGGILGGVWTSFILWTNGLSIGAIATLVGQNNLAYPFWAFVFPHGSLELPAIFISGGAGLCIAQGLLFPGQNKRLDAIKIGGSRAIQLMFGVVPMLVIAGAIEGFFSPSPLVPSAAKYLVGLSIFFGLILYLRRQPQSSPQP